MYCQEKDSQREKGGQREHGDGNVSAEFGNQALIARNAGSVAGSVAGIAEIIHEVLIDGYNEAD